MRHHATALVLLVAACAAGTPPSPAGPAAAAGGVNRDFPGLPFIREAELRRDLFALGGDHTRGREAGTLDELRASVWLAERAREAGLEPAGDENTYFQWFPLRRIRQSSTSSIVIGGQPLRLWTDVALSGTTSSTVNAPIVWIADPADTLAAVSGRVAAVQVRSGSDAPPLESALAARRYGPRIVNAAAAPLLRRGAVAVIVVADAAFDAYFDLVATNAMRGSYALEDGSEARIPSGAPTLIVRSASRALVQNAAGSNLEARLVVERFEYPSVNVVARVPGTDPAVRHEVVLFSGHQDHDGVRAPIAGDSTYNGADDNVTVSVALLAIGRAFAQRPGRRTALFVWHGAEEKGLFGSNWHVRHPLLPRENIVAVLNGDMIGRNHPDTAALLGSIPPNRNSADLVAMAHDANRRVTTFAIDSSWDRPTHPERWYTRSDHLPYARAGIPALFFTTLLHEDYHTPFDNPSRIDVVKLTRMTQWMYATGWLAANAAQRPRLDATPPR